MSAFPIPKNLLLTQLCAVGPDTLDWRDCGIVFRVQTLSAGPSSSHWQLDFTEQFWGEVLAHHAVCTPQLDSQHWGPSLPFLCVVGVPGMGRAPLLILGDQGLCTAGRKELGQHFCTLQAEQEIAH